MAGALSKAASWESLAELQKTYPNLNLEDKIPAEEETNGPH